VILGLGQTLSAVSQGATPREPRRLSDRNVAAADFVTLSRRDSPSRNCTIALDEA
jgi:hypothetical protein